MLSYGRFTLVFCGYDSIMIYDNLFLLLNHVVHFLLVLSPQVHTLLKGLEKIAISADIPMLVCGDFNTVPGRY